MSAADYTDHYDPTRNPKSAMDRVLANCGIDSVGRVALHGPRRDGDPELVVSVDLPCLGAAVLAEAERAGFAFLRCGGGAGGHVEARFGVDGA